MKRKRKRKKGKEEQEDSLGYDLVLFKISFGYHSEIIFESFLRLAGQMHGARSGLEGSWAILTDKTHAIVRAPPISLQSGEPRTLKHCKNTYKMSVQFCPAAGIPSTGP